MTRTALSYHLHISIFLRFQNTLFPLLLRTSYITLIDFGRPFIDKPLESILSFKFSFFFKPIINKSVKMKYTIAVASLLAVAFATEPAAYEPPSYPSGGDSGWGTSTIEVTVTVQASECAAGTSAAPAPPVYSTPAPAPVYSAPA